MSSSNLSHGTHSLSRDGSQVKNTVNSDHLDDVFGILSNSRRRAVISIVMEHENISKRELVELVTAREYGMSLEQVPGSKERQTVHTSLHQTHLPKLDKDGVVEWDEQGDRIMLGANADEIIEVMSKVNSSEQSLTDRAKCLLSV